MDAIAEPGNLGDLTVTGVTLDASGDFCVGDLLFNPLQLSAARGNSKQAALDYAWQAKLLAESSLAVTLSGTPVTLDFAPSRLAFFGHSQGAATGPLLATSEAVVAQVLSAPSGHLATNLLGKTEPSDALSISSMLEYLICDAEGVTLDVHHPFLNLLLAWFEDTDAANYAPLFIAEAPEAQKHLFVLAGTEDHYVAPASHDAVTTAARLHQLAPELAAVPGQSLLAELWPDAGYGTSFASLSGNLGEGENAVTGAFRQYHGEIAVCADDHFVATCTTMGRSDFGQFFETLAEPPPTVP